jgi:hypothetical protein
MSQRIRFTELFLKSPVTTSLGLNNGVSLHEYLFVTARYVHFYTTFPRMHNMNVWLRDLFLFMSLEAACCSETPITLPGAKARENQHQPFEVLTVVVMKSSIFWDITPCSLLKVNRRFGGTYRLHLQDRRISEARNQYETCSKPMLVSFLVYYLSVEMLL